MGNKPKTPGKAPAGGTLHSPTDKKIGKSKAGAKGHTAGSVEPMLPADAMSLEERIRQNRKQLQDVERQVRAWLACGYERVFLNFCVPCMLLGRACILSGTAAICLHLTLYHCIPADLQPGVPVL